MVFVVIGVVWLGMWLEDVAAVVNNSPAVGKMSWKYKDQFSKFLANAKAMGKSGHARALNLLAEVEKQSKSGVGDAAENVERFILALSPAASSLSLAGRGPG